MSNITEKTIADMSEEEYFELMYKLTGVRYYKSDVKLKWGENISPENMELLKGGARMILLDKGGFPYSEVLRCPITGMREHRLHLT